MFFKFNLYWLKNRILAYKSHQTNVKDYRFIAPSKHRRQKKSPTKLIRDICYYLFLLVYFLY